MPDTPLRRLIDLPGLAELEHKALMSPRLAEPENLADYPEVDAWLLQTFGLTSEAAEDTPRPEGWDRIERKSPSEQVQAFEAAGWDVTDAKRRPLRMLAHISLPLWLAIRGVAGTVPFVAAPSDEPDPWGGGMAADAKRFQRDRR